MNDYNEKEGFETDNDESVHGERNSSEPVNNRPEETVKENTDESAPAEEKQAESYEFNPDGTYRYVRPPQQGNPESRPFENTGSYRSQTPPNTGMNNNNVNPYSNRNNSVYGSSNNNNNPYPYVNNRNSEYPGDINGGYNPKKNSNNAFKIVGIACIALLVAIVAVIVIMVLGDKSKGNTPQTNTPQSSVTDESSTVNSNVDEIETTPTPESGNTVTVSGVLSAQEVYKKVASSSVGIIIYSGASSGFNVSSSSITSEGSGILFQESKDGKYTYVATCAHTISDAKGSIVVQLSDNTEYPATVVGYDSRTDTGVLKIEAKGLNLAEIGDSDAVCVGDTVYAIGNPGGTEFAGSFTNGMVSALDRPVSSSSTGYTMQCIQHTAPINPGNSGGALVNVYGQVIGINSSKIVADEYEGMGFSIPSSVFVDVINKIIVNGYVADRAKLGITYVSASDYSTYGMYVTLKGLPAGSLVIYGISDDSDLKNTEAKEGDMIIAVNGKDLTDTSTLAAEVEKGSVGDELKLTLVRINEDYTYEKFDITVKLVADVESKNSSSSSSSSSGNSGSSNGNYGYSYGHDDDDEFDIEDFFKYYYGGN